MEDMVASNPRRLEHHRDLNDALKLSFSMEDLPLEIQPLVISQLSLKEAARTSIVARNWRKLWTCYPNLCFDGSKDQSTDEDSIKIETANFIETVNSIIQQHNGIGLNKFSIRFTLQKKSSHHLDSWICFATAAKARIIYIDLSPKTKVLGPAIKAYNFPLEALGAQGGAFIRSLFLKDVSIKPHLDICGFTELKRLCLHCVQITGDLADLLVNCLALEELEFIACSGVVGLNIPHRLDKLRHLLIFSARVQMVDFHVPGLTHFEYKGKLIPIALHGCPNLEKATLMFKTILKQENKSLAHAFTAIPGISTVKVLNLQADMEANEPVWAPQVHKLMTRPTCMFMFLKHLTCEIRIFTNGPNSHDGILQLAHYLEFAPQLEVLQLHMFYYTIFGDSWHGDVTWAGGSYMCSLDHLKVVYMSGFRCYRAQVELLWGILEKGTALEHVTIEPKVIVKCVSSMNLNIPEEMVREWAQRASKRFGKKIYVMES